MRTTQRRWVRVLIEVRKKITIKKKTSTLCEVIYNNNNNNNSNHHQINMIIAKTIKKFNKMMKNWYLINYVNFINCQIYRNYSI